MDFTDFASTNLSQRSYRTRLIFPPAPLISLTNLTSGNTLVRIDNATQPYRLEQTTNGLDWIGLATNFAFREIEVRTSSSSSNNLPPTTFLTASRPHFLAPSAFGVQNYTFLAGNLTAGAWMQLTLTKTNNQVVIIGTTNLVAGLSSTNLAHQIYNSINNHPALQSNDGVIAEDFYVVGGQARFVLRARSPGYSAALLKISPKTSGFATGISVTPGFYHNLTQNLADLQPRNHLYVTVGTTRLKSAFSLDTTQLSDGYHELTAVAYEGSSVRTQTRTSIPVCISNSPLSATLTLLDLTNNAPANATYHIQVSANTNNVSLTTLFSTGGPIGFATNNPSAIFDVIGTNLWAGLHPFYALVETATGQKYRTKTSWIRLQ